MIEDLAENQRLDQKAVTQGNNTVLHEAAASGSLDLVKYLIEDLADNQRLDPRAIGQYGTTVLDNAVESENLNLVKYLVERGANLRAGTTPGYGVLHNAARRGNLELVRYLVEHYHIEIGNAGFIDKDIKMGFHLLAYFADLGSKIRDADRPQVDLIRQRAKKALEGRQIRGPVDRKPSINKEGKQEPSKILRWQRIGKYADLVGVSEADVKNDRFIYPDEVDGWNYMPNEARSSIYARIKGVQSEEYLFYRLEKIRLEELAELERLEDQSHLASGL